MKYMLATLCSKPAATKAAIGGTMARTLSVGRARAEAEPHGEADERVAEHPQDERLPEPRLVFAVAIESAWSPIAPPPSSYCLPA